MDAGFPCTQKPLPSAAPYDLHGFFVRKPQLLLQLYCFRLFHLQQQFQTAVVQKSVAEFAVAQRKVVDGILRGRNEDAAVSTYCFNQLDRKIRRLLVALFSRDLPQFIPDYGDFPRV